MTFEGKAKWFWRETSYIKLITLYVHPKNSNHLRSHSRAIMSLDHNARIRPGKQNLGKHIRPNFLRSTSLLYKILPTNLGVCKPTFYTFYTSHLRWNSTIYDKDLGHCMQYLILYQEKLHSVNIQDDQCWAFSETVRRSGYGTNYEVNVFQVPLLRRMVIMVAKNTW